MLSTFRETLISIQDKTYGRVIIAKSFKSVLWYWTKYVLIFTIIPVLIFIAAATYLVPQLPKLLTDHLPSFDVSISDGKFHSSLEDPLILGNQDFILIIDPQGDTSRLDSAFAGLMVLEDHVIFKDESGQREVFKLSDFPDFSLSKNVVTDWITHHQRLLWFLSVLAILILGILAFSFYWTSNLVSFFLWALIFWVGSRVLNKTVAYTKVLRLAVYSAVPSLLLSLVLSFAPNKYLSFLNIGVFIFFILSWMWNLNPPPPKVVHGKTKLKK